MLRSSGRSTHRWFHASPVRATAVEIDAARRHLFASYGSCSWREPVEDLRGLGVLE